jgi:hypothetical protein
VDVEVLKFFLVVVMVVGLFFGCSNRERVVLDSLKRDKFTNLRDGERLVFNRGFDGEFIVMVNYVPKVDREEFIISTDGQIDPKSLLLDGKRATASKEIQHKSLKGSLKGMVPKWSNIYRVSFKKVESSKMTMVIPFKGDKQSVVFYKKPKYLLQKPSFKR